MTEDYSKGFTVSPVDDELSQNVPSTGKNGFQRPVLYSSDGDPSEIYNLNAGSLRVDDSANVVGNILSGSASVAKNLTGIAAYSFISGQSMMSNSLGGIESYSIVGSFTTSVYDPSIHSGIGSYGNFGNSLSTNGNGSLVIIGNKTSIVDGYYVGIGDSIGITTYYGSAYLYERVGDNLLKRGCIVGQYGESGEGSTHGVGIASTSNDDFGHSTTMSLDGKTFAIGGPKVIGENTEDGISPGRVGVVWVYEYNSPSTIPSEFCGISTSNTCCGIGTSTFCEIIESNLLETPYLDVCGIGYTTICKSDNIKSLTKFQGERDGDLFGHSISISADSKVLVIGAPGAKCPSSSYDGGAAYVYERNDNSYEKIGVLSGISSGRFGSCVSVSAEGNVVAVGDTVNKNTYVYFKNPKVYGSYIKIATLGSGGTQVCVSDDGYTIITSDELSSTVYDLKENGTNPMATLSCGSVGISCSPDGRIIGTASSTGYNIHNREGNTFYFNYGGGGSGVSLPLDSFDMSTNTKVVYRGLSKEYVAFACSGKVHCDDQKLETFVYTHPDGNIGVNTPGPEAKLHVNGGLFVSGIATVGLGSTSTPTVNSTMSFELTDNNTLTVRVKGTDGVVRVGIVTLV